MRKLILIAAVAVVSATSALAGVDEKLPAALGKASEPPRIIEAPKPPDPPKAAETAKPAEEPKAAETPKTDQPPQYVARPAAVGTKTDQSKAGQVTFEDNKPVAEKARPAVEKDQRTAKAEKPRRKRAYWNEARIMRELSRHGIYW
jgi:outer membrane biosynthesis protein TonB